MHLFGEIIRSIAGLTVAGIAAFQGVGDATTTAGQPAFSPEERGFLTVSLDDATSTARKDTSTSTKNLEKELSEHVPAKVGALILSRATSSRLRSTSTREILTSGTIGTASSSSFTLKVKSGPTKNVLTTASTTISVQNGSTTITETKDLPVGKRVIVVGTPQGTDTISATAVTGGSMELRTSNTSDKDQKAKQKDTTDAVGSKD